ncbi:MAG: hypothetical protein JSS02_13005 [Planctomycetes bacterium]|nr:hypothetical protein [Planctomycetota bacterium]
MSLLSTVSIKPQSPSAGPLTDDGRAVERLQQQLHATRRAAMKQQRLAGICWLAMALALALAGMALIDFYAELATPWRAAWLVVCLTAILIGGIQGWRQILVRNTLKRTAADAEGHLATFGQRLRTTLDYAHNHPEPAPASATLLTALRTDAVRLADQTDWKALVSTRPALLALVGLVGVAMAWSAGLFAYPEFRIASGRACLLPFEYTTVAYSPRQSTVKIGESIEITAQVTGRPIESAQLRYRETGSQAEWKTVDLVSAEIDSTDSADTPSPKLSGTLTARIENLQHDLEMEVVAGPRPLPPGSITVLQPLTIESSEASIVPPAYTGKPAQAVEGLDLKVWEGSAVHVQLTLNRPAAEAKLSPLMSGQPPANGSAAAAAESTPSVTTDGELIKILIPDVRHDVVFSISATAADGMELSPERLSVRVQLDRKPEIKFLQPSEELVVTPTTEVPVVAEAKDDLGLHKVGVVFQVGSDEFQVLKEVDAAGAAEPLTLSEVLELESQALTHKSAITYYAYAEDNYFGTPRRTTTPLRYIDIRPYKLAYQLQEGDGSCCNGSSVTLEELIHRQRQQLTQTFAAREAPAPDSEVNSRLSAAQSELLEVTREFTAGIEQKLGPVLPLSAAVMAMERTVQALDSAQLDQAFAAEQDALASLIATRENLRQKLSQSSSSSASASRKFDREMRQKLRTPKPKPADQQQRMADLRKKLDDLAKRQRSLSQSCSQCNSSSSSSSPNSGKPQSSASARPQSTTPNAEGQKPEDRDPSTDNPPNTPNSPESGTEPTPSTPAEIAAAQQKLQAELARLREELAQLKQAGQAASAQAEEADHSMQQSQTQLERGDLERAAREGDRSAEQLEKLSDHLAAMNSRDFGQRLEMARQFAQQLARQEAGLEQQLQEDSSADRGSSPQGENQPGSETKPAGQPGKTGGNPPSSTGRGSNASPDSALNGTGDATEPAAGSGKLPTTPRNSAGLSPGSRTSQQAADLARDQQKLAGEADLLADQLHNLERDASAEKGNLKTRLTQAQTENSPRDIAQLMRRVAADIGASQTGHAARGSRQARERLEELSKALGAARADFAQPQLEELMTLEDQLAKVREQLKRAGEQADEKSAAQRQWDAVEPRLDDLASVDKKIAEALQNLRDGTVPAPNSDSPAAPSQSPPSSGSNPSQPGTFRPQGGSEPPRGHYLLRPGDYRGLEGVLRVLQARIQEAILAGALMDADQPVPQEYRDLVEKYYRALSDDLR